MAVADTHCHLDMIEDSERSILDFLGDARLAGVTDVVQIAVSKQSSEFNRNLSEMISEKNGSEDLPGFWYTAGIHPETVSEYDEFSSLKDLILDWVSKPAPPVAIGEVGLDYYQNPETRELQKTRFRMFFELAQQTNLPVVVHLRDDRVYNPDKLDAVQDALELAREFESVRGVLHCYTYGYKEALPFVELGWMVSYSGIMTYKNAAIVQEGAFQLPLESLMVETDAPFLSPVPHRGKRNEPAYVVHTLEFLKSMRSHRMGEAPEKIEDQIYKNSKLFFGW